MPLGGYVKEAIVPQMQGSRFVIDLLLPLLEACHNVSSPRDFKSRVYPELCRIMPHRMFVCGTANLEILGPGRIEASVNHLENMGFPEGYLQRIIDPSGRVNSPLVRRWLETQTPVHYGEHSGGWELPGLDTEWKYLFGRYGFRSLAAHGMIDVSGKAASYFCFAGVGNWRRELAYLLELAVPHLHVALIRQAPKLQAPKLQAAEPQAGDRQLLSPRESEVLRLICTGKTNGEMGQILGISAWTVKVHVRNLMSKLNVSTRGHAVAKAMNLGVVCNPRTL